MTGEMQDDSLLARRWPLILAMAVRFADSHPSVGRQKYMYHPGPVLPSDGGQAFVLMSRLIPPSLSGQAWKLSSRPTSKLEK